MSTIRCAKCGGDTNTAVADHLNNKSGEADCCYARYENGKWVKGCGLDDADEFTKKLMRRCMPEIFIAPADAGEKE
jgi:hypothetical protein